MSHNHQQVIKARVTTAGETARAGRDDPFARLVAAVAADVDNPFNIERYLWVLEEPPARPCGWCGAMFDPWYGYDGVLPAQGPARRYCSRRCAGRAAYERRQARRGHHCPGPPYWELSGSQRRCGVCGAVFDPAITYDGRPTRYGRRRSCCSRACQARRLLIATPMGSRDGTFERAAA